jgi:hypothetical protein
MRDAVHQILEEVQEQYKNLGSSSSNPVLRQEYQPLTSPQGSRFTLAKDTTTS